MNESVKTHFYGVIRAYVASESEAHYDL